MCEGTASSEPDGGHCSKGCRWQVRIVCVCVYSVVCMYVHVFIHACMQVCACVCMCVYVNLMLSLSAL